MDKIKEEVIQKNGLDYIRVTYKNGAFIEYPASNGSVEETPIVIPPSPLEVLKEENKNLKEKVSQLETLILQSQGVI